MYFQLTRGGAGTAVAAVPPSYAAMQVTPEATLYLDTAQRDRPFMLPPFLGLLWGAPIVQVHKGTLMELLAQPWPSMWDVPVVKTGTAPRRVKRKGAVTETESEAETENESVTDDDGMDNATDVEDEVDADADADADDADEEYDDECEEAPEDYDYGEQSVVSDDDTD